MEDLKRFIFPSIAAIILHGFLISYKLPEPQILKPILKRDPIKIEISAFSPQSPVSKKIEYKKEEVTAKPISPPKVVQKKIIEPPAVIRQQQKKIIMEPELTKEEPVIEEKDKSIETRKQQIENLVKSNNEVSPETVIDQPVVKQVTGDVLNENIEDDSEGILPKKEISIAPIQKKAIPIYRRNKQPPYPVMAKRRGYEGKILLSVLVNTEGMVSELRIKQSSGHLSLDRVAFKAVKTWLFVPATEGGRPVPMWVDVPIEFKLM